MENAFMYYVVNKKFDRIIFKFVRKKCSKDAKKTLRYNILYHIIQDSNY